MKILHPFYYDCKNFIVIIITVRHASTDVVFLLWVFLRVAVCIDCFESFAFPCTIFFLHSSFCLLSHSHSLPLLISPHSSASSTNWPCSRVHFPWHHATRDSLVGSTLILIIFFFNESKLLGGWYNTLHFYAYFDRWISVYLILFFIRDGCFCSALFPWDGHSKWCKRFSKTMNHSINRQAVLLWITSELQSGISAVNKAFDLSTL